ncbi:uncharacterized protein LOC134242320 [Saccostrea cucullata]|uniref:uncharacterized protein LOC134242320 n=1 Tax=Saccostrea cuccullata TaxID=36930 RepID=UPI002ED5BB5D
MDTAQKAFGGCTSPEVFQEQIIVRFALGCNDGEAGQQLINYPPRTLEEAIKRVKTFQLSHSECQDFYVARRERSESRDRTNRASRDRPYRASEDRSPDRASRDSLHRASEDRPRRASRDRSDRRASRDRSESPD